MLKVLPFTLMLILFLAGCSHQRDTHVSPDNPASPSAAEAPAPNTAQGIAPGVSGQAAAGGGEAKSSSMDNMAGMSNMEHMNMSKDSGTSDSQAQGKKEVLYTCPMHPQVIKTKPGNCPICGMKLVPKK